MGVEFGSEQAARREDARRQALEEAELQRALQKFHEASRNINPTVEQAIRDGTLTDEDRRSTSVQAAEAAWHAYLTLTGGAIAEPGHELHMRA